MMRKQINIAGFILFFCLVFMVGAWYYNARYIQALSRGSYFFEKTKNTIDVQSIELVFPGNHTVSFVNKDNFWRVTEADGYFASFGKMNTLTKLIHNTAIYRSDHFDAKSDNALVTGAVLLKTFDSKGNIIDEATVAPKKENQKFHYALLNNDHNLYQLIGSFDFSSNVLDWIQMPLLSIDQEQIKYIKTDKFTVSRRFSAEKLREINSNHDVPQVAALVQNFWYLNAIEVKHALHFNREKLNLIRSYEIATFDGLIYLIDVFNEDKDFWLNIRLKSDDIISSSALRFLKENNILYDGWFFKISEDIGQNIGFFVL